MNKLLERMMGFQNNPKQNFLKGSITAYKLIYSYKIAQDFSIVLIFRDPL